MVDRPSLVGKNTQKKQKQTTQTTDGSKINQKQNIKLIKENMFIRFKNKLFKVSRELLT